jgi:hypothetical protein
MESGKHGPGVPAESSALWSSQHLKDVAKIQNSSFKYNTVSSTPVLSSLLSVGHMLLYVYHTRPPTRSLKTCRNIAQPVAMLIMAGVDLHHGPTRQPRHKESIRKLVSLLV